MIELSEELKKRFCKDQNLPIQVYKEPYFTERLKLFGAYSDYCDFVGMIITKFDTDGQSYFTYYNNLKDQIIDYIKNSEAFKSLNQANLTDMKINFPSADYYSSIKKGDAYKDTNIGETFISIDMRKANFNALLQYGKEIGHPFIPEEGNNIDESWKKFIGMFTDIPYFATSKYIRQVVFGNCNPKRVIRYETYLMENFLSQIQFKGEGLKTVPLRSQLAIPLFSNADIYSMCSDEIILHADNLSPDAILYIEKNILRSDFELRMDTFTIGKIKETDVFVKIYPNGEKEIKCASPVEAVFAKRILNHEPITKHDLYIKTEYGNAILQDVNVTQMELVTKIENEKDEELEYGE